ncbi:dienelactone hydrolase [Rhizobium herbae]|uniref:Dienelactone hydrolase n=1 Tax=Rhizobium herbae TaxID=508661 RepID=A0ABS7H846_9HYPH|nr:dienelactone hydrolase [Rhizobium herbae]MBW9063431.1 dienelactone hydrolase [Rhizobium herbae]
MFSISKHLCFLCTVAISAVMMHHPADAKDNVGVRQIVARSTERGSNLDVTVWYPAQLGGEQVMLGESIFFVGTPAWRDAPILEGKFPLVLLSHGAGLAGSPQALSWIATPLAQQGFVVAAPMHPGNSGRNRSAAETMKIWLRPGDLTETLDAMERDSFFQEHLEQGNVGALGLSMGGGTALAIAGARINPNLLAGYCDTDALNASLCEWVRQSGADLHAMNLQSAGRDNEDKRIRFAMAIDPAPIDVFEFKSFSGISIPIELINLGRPNQIPPTLQASEVAKSIPTASYTTIRDASHYSMFAECNPGASQIAESERIGDPICMDGGGRSRSELHAQLIDMVIAAFNRVLKAVP